MTELEAANLAFDRALDRFGYLLISIGAMMFLGTVLYIHILFLQRELQQLRRKCCGCQARAPGRETSP